jgi:hypothetical protein
MKTSPPKATLYLGALLPFVSAPADAAVEVATMAELSLNVLVPCAAGGFGEVVDLSECR